MEPTIACPKCGYTRRKTDAGPEWQCAACGIAIHKVRELAVEAQAIGIAKAVPVKYEARMPLVQRAMGALPDLLTAGLFLWCWIAPNAWRKTLPGELATVMIIQFFVMHASIFLAAASPSAGTGARLIGGMVIFAVYTPIVGAICYFHGDWLPLAAFAWLLFSQVVAMIAASGSDEFQAKRLRYYWSRSTGYYLVICIIVMGLLPIPACGMRGADMSASVMRMDDPASVMAWGTLYFGWLGMTRLLEKPEWIEGAAFDDS